MDRPERCHDSPKYDALWQWWGPERLYRDLALGVAADEVRQIVCGPRWIMVEGPCGAGLAYLPRSPQQLLPRLPHLRRQSLSALAALTQSWDPLEMALGIAAINAHYNRSGLAARAGNGASLFRRLTAALVAIGGFPGLSGILPDCTVIETEPRPGEFPLDRHGHPVARMRRGCSQFLRPYQSQPSAHPALAQDGRIGLDWPIHATDATA